MCRLSPCPAAAGEKQSTKRDLKYLLLGSLIRDWSGGQSRGIQQEEHYVACGMGDPQEARRPSERSLRRQPSLADPDIGHAAQVLRLYPGEKLTSVRVPRGGHQGLGGGGSRCLTGTELRFCRKFWRRTHSNVNTLGVAELPPGAGQRPPVNSVFGEGPVLPVSSGVMQLDPRRRTGLLAAHAGLWVTSQEAHGHLEGGVQLLEVNGREALWMTKSSSVREDLTRKPWRGRRGERKDCTAASLGQPQRPEAHQRPPPTISGTPHEDCSTGEVGAGDKNGFTCLGSPARSPGPDYRE
ncbi:uncharacterized protein LOC131513219 [Neofelis nebulosa]|uniref:uncharacterized protein LOC131513219 n=1 Tax=Neofelis nebulosa TaxID=61452 RepID=UPI00272A0180|nr:uncharacterized protein LOC131513219 [Neofelis nebulosa]